jgi:hypothetical protein
MGVPFRLPFASPSWLSRLVLIQTPNLADATTQCRFGVNRLIRSWNLRCISMKTCQSRRPRAAGRAAVAVFRWRNRRRTFRATGESIMLRFNCPTCKKSLSLPDEIAGSILVCPGCMHPVTVLPPASQSVPVATPPSLPFGRESEH